MSKLYVVRHGRTDWNVKRIYQSVNDIELNEEGINQAKELSKTIDLSNIDICISSPLKRAYDTAKILVGDKIDIIKDDLLVERNEGDYEGTLVTDETINLQWDYKKNFNDNGLESIQDILLRAKTFLDKIKKDYPNKNILVVSHGGFIKALHYNIIGYDDDTDFLEFHAKNTTLYEYNLDM